MIISDEESIKKEKGSLNVGISIIVPSLLTPIILMKTEPAFSSIFI